MYESSDPRTALAATVPPVEARGSATPDGPTSALHCVEFLHEEPTQITASGSKIWIVRGQNFVLEYCRARTGDIFRRTDQQDEYVVVLPSDGSSVDARAGTQRLSCAGQGVIIMPPGASEIHVTADADIVRLFTVRATDLVAKASNSDSYDSPHPHVAPFVAWPEPHDGHRIRAYAVADVPRDDARFGRIYRCSSFMVNFLYPHEGPRDVKKMSPHHHDDFEQCSLAVQGEFVHHVRTPWTPRLDEWREDDHVRCTTPSVAIIPPPTVHTSQGIGPGTNQLIDIFCPPRGDFSAKPGWVLNADEYPMP